MQIDTLTLPWSLDLKTLCSGGGVGSLNIYELKLNPSLVCKNVALYLYVSS